MVKTDNDVITMNAQGDQIQGCIAITSLTWSNGGIVKDDRCDVQTLSGVSILKLTADKDNGFYSLPLAQPLCVNGVNVVTLDHGVITIYKR